MNSDNVYALSNRASEQASASTANRAAGTVQMRILIELQVITMLLAQAYESTEQIEKLRQDVADSIT